MGSKIVSVIARPMRFTNNTLTYMFDQYIKQNCHWPILWTNAETANACSCVLRGPPLLLMVCPLCVLLLFCGTGLAYGILLYPIIHLVACADPWWMLYRTKFLTSTFVFWYHFCNSLWNISHLYSTFSFYPHFIVNGTNIIHEDIFF